MPILVSKAKPLLYIIDASHIDEKGVRADRILSGLEGLPSRSQLKVWFEEGRVKRGGKAIFAASTLFVGDEIEVFPSEPKQLHLEPRELKFHIYYEDEFLIVLYKPRGISMHPGASQKDEMTLAHALVHHAKNLSTTGGEFRPGIVHRLDKDTEGIVVVAKNNEVHEELSSKFAERSIERAYWALCYGRFPQSIKIDAPIGRNPRDRKKMAVVTSGKAAVTEVKLLEYFQEGYSWVECKLHTGRTHQIRVHMSHKKFPLMNDPAYSKKRSLKLNEAQTQVLSDLKGQALVAYKLGFVHPVTSKTIYFEAEMPDWLKILTKKGS